MACINITAAHIDKVSKHNKVYLNAVMGEELNDEETHLCRSLDEMLEHCFVLMKKGETELAANQLKPFENTFNALSSRCKRWISVYSLPYASYCYYKTNAFETAKKTTVLSIRYANYFENKGYDYFVLTRIQQQFNLVRIYLRENKMSKAIRLAVVCLKEIYSSGPSFLNKVAFLADKTEFSFRSEMMYLYTHQVISETCGRLMAIIQKPEELRKRLLEFILATEIKELQNMSLVYPRFDCLRKFVSLLHLIIINYTNLEHEKMLVEQLSADAILDRLLHDYLRKYLPQELHLI